MNGTGSLFTVQVSDQRLLLHFEQLPKLMQKNLTTTVTKLTNELLGRVRGAEPVRTGLLRSSTRSFVDVTEDMVRGRVRILATGRASRTAAAFGALEYGAHRAFVVSAYRRQGIAVQAYERRANIAAQRFLRGSAEAMRARIITELEGTVAKSVEETNRA
jgi:hypothetical protein